MLESGNPPNDWAALVQQAGKQSDDALSAMATAAAEDKNSC